MLASMDRMNRAATVRSARLAFAGSAGSISRRGPPCPWPSPVSAGPRAAGAAGLRRAQHAPRDRGRRRADHPARPGRLAPPLPGRAGLLVSGRLHSCVSLLSDDPDGDEDQQADAADPDHEPLGDRADPAQAEPAGVRLRAGLGDEGDDVALLAREDRAVAEPGMASGPVSMAS